MNQRFFMRLTATRKVGLCRAMLGSLFLWPGMLAYGIGMTFFGFTIDRVSDPSDPFQAHYDAEQGCGLAGSFDRGFVAWLGNNPRMASRTDIEHFETAAEAIEWLRERSAEV